MGWCRHILWYGLLLSNILGSVTIHYGFYPIHLISIPFQCHHTVSATLAKPLAYPVFGPWRSLKPQLTKPNQPFFVGFFLFYWSASMWQRMHYLAELFLAKKVSSNDSIPRRLKNVEVLRGTGAQCNSQSWAMYICMCTIILYIYTIHTCNVCM